MRNKITLYIVRRGEESITQAAFFNYNKAYKYLINHDYLRPNYSNPLWIEEVLITYKEFMAIYMELMEDMED